MHPQVSMGLKSKTALLDEFEHFFGRAEITDQAIIAFFENESDLISDDDEFGLMLSYCWGLPFIPSYSLKRINKMIRKSILDKCGDDSKRADDYLHEVFKMYDADASQGLNFNEFIKLLATFGVKLPAKETHVLFDHFDKDGNHVIDFFEFKTTIATQLSSKELRKESMRRK
eukprot:c16238_g1_i1.p1 GENE.c16238_g1_i1~~c16238_g1_i1.p1  ORF type:complete len:172 (+),score=38.55 c16238_g1_i1:514-1029(+)